MPNITTVDPDRTFWDKVTILHGLRRWWDRRGELRGGGQQVSRHYYDLHSLLRSADGERYITDELWAPTACDTPGWADAKIQRLEDLIPDFVAGVMRTAVALRLHEQELKERELDRQKRAQEMIKLREQIEVEEKKMEQFNQWIESWEKAGRLRRFIAAYAEKTSKWAAEKQSHYKEWIAWANQQADRVDPFVSEKPVSVLDRKHELRRWYGVNPLVETVSE